MKRLLPAGARTSTVSALSPRRGQTLRFRLCLGEEGKERGRGDEITSSSAAAQPISLHMCMVTEVYTQGNHLSSGVCGLAVRPRLQRARETPLVMCEVP